MGVFGYDPLRSLRASMHMWVAFSNEKFGHEVEVIDLGHNLS